MSREALSPQEAAVNQHLAEAQDRITVLEWQINNLPADKGPQLKPSGGPVATQTRSERKVELEKQIASTKEAMLANVERELKDAPPDVQERSNRAVDDLLCGDQKHEEQKDIGASQAYAESRRHAYQTRYKDATEPERVMEGTQERDKGSALDQSQGRAYQMRYKDKSERADADRGSRDISKDAIEPDKD
jgi:hypothetical protein